MLLWLATCNVVQSTSYFDSNLFYWTFQGGASFVNRFCYIIMFHVGLCYVVLSVPCRLVITC